MHLDLKMQAWNCNQMGDFCTDSSTAATVNMDIAWVVAYAPGSAPPDGTPAPTSDPTVPGGVSMPSSPPTGYREVFSDNFTETSLDPHKWSVYSGHPPLDPVDTWSPTHVTVGGHELVLSAYKDPVNNNTWTSGGLSSGPGLVQTYGSYLVRFRMDAGVGVTYVAILFPHSNVHPPEVDFAEDNGEGTRQATRATLHSAQGGSEQATTQSLSVDLTQWHTLGVKWSPSEIQYTVDGTVWGTESGARVPSVPMVLDLQTQVWPCGFTGETCPTSATPPVVNMDVAWVVAYAPSNA